MGRSKKKRKRTTGEQQHVDGGILPLLYPTSRLCTLHDLLLSLLLPSLQHHHAPPSSRTTVEHPGMRTQQVANNEAGQTMGANVDMPQEANMGMRQAALSAYMVVNMQPTVATDVGVYMGMQQAATPVNMGSNMGFPQTTIAVDMGVQQVQASKVAMYIDTCEAASTMSSKDMGARQTTLGTDLIRQQVALTSAAVDKTAIAAAHSFLVREGDPADYLYLLSHGYGVLPDTAPPLGHTMLEQRWTHQQVIERAIQILFKQGKNNSNVLCFGFQQPRPRSCLKRERAAPAGLACVSDNAAVTVLNSQTWRTIHARVGDLIMLHLLSYADIFQPLPHKCYVQVAGTSVLLFSQQNKTSEQCAVPATKILTDKQHASRKKQRVERSKDTERGGGSADVGAHMNARNRHCVSNASEHPETTTRKRERPHSWQRRKARRLYGNQAGQEGDFNVMKERRVHMEPEKQEFVMRASETCLANSLDIVGGCLGTQEEHITVSGAKAVTLSNAQNDNRSHDNIQVLVLDKSRKFEKVKNDWPNILIPGLSSQERLFCSAATIYEQSNDNMKDRKKQSMDGFSTRSSFAKLAFGTQQKQVHKVSKRGNFEMPLARSCITSGYHAGRGGRRLINRTRMFYKAKFPHHAGLSKNHLLQRLTCSSKDTTILFEAIFGKESICRIKTSAECHVLRSKTCCKCIFCLLKKMISNARHCQFSRFLKRHCSPCSTSRTHTKEPAKNLNFKVGVRLNVNHDEECMTKGRSDGVMNHADLMQGTCETPVGQGFDGSGKVLAEENSDFSSHSQVVAFVWAVCRRIVPKELLGSRKNWRNLRRNIFAFVSLRRHESFSLEQCMFKLKLIGYPWCQEQCLDGCSLNNGAPGGSTAPEETENDSKNNSRHARVGSARGGPKKTNISFQILKRMLLEKWIYWLFSGLIVPLIQAHFYVTESEKYKQDVLFYRKSVWAKIKASAVKEMMKNNFKRLSVQSTVKLLKQGSLGFSRARLLPKKAGMRLIANLGSSSAISANYTRDEVGKVSKRRGKHGNLLKSHARMTKVSKDKEGLIFKPINVVLRDLHHCLKYEQEKHVEDLGCSVFDYNDAYLKLLPYITGYKRASNTAAPLFLVVCDVLQAFDTIKQDKLVEIVQEFVHEEEYCVMRYGYASPNMNSIKVFHERSAMSTVKGMTSLDIFLHLAAKQRNAVCIDQAYAVKLKRSHIFEVLKEHLLRNIIQIGQHFYLQVVGIPQGSILSSLLCSLYYGHLERSRLARTLHLEHRLNSRKQLSIGTNIVFKASSLTKADSTSFHLEPRSNARSIKLYLGNGAFDSIKCLVSQSDRTGGQCMTSPLSCKCLGNAAVMTEDAQHRNIMLRFVDDWLFISNSQDDALEFVRKMHRGFVDYNCVANRLKTAVSFDASLGGSTLNMNVYRTQDGACYIRWSGLLINCNTLEVQADYTRYCGVELRSTLTIWRRNNQGHYLMAKLCQFMRPKCHPIFYDANINSPATVFLNAYQAFLLCAMKFHAYNCSLPCGGSCNPEFGFRAVQKSARYMHSLLEHRTSKISKSSKVKPLLLMHAKDMQWLALSAFRKVLMRKQSRYVRLLYLIKTELQSPKYNELGESPLMLSALDPRRSSMFEDIIY